MQSNETARRWAHVSPNATRAHDLTNPGPGPITKHRWLEPANASALAVLFSRAGGLLGKGYPPMVVVLCKRRRYVVARWLNCPYEPAQFKRAANWPDLERQAQRFWAAEGELYREDHTISAPAWLARRAEWR